MAVETSSPVEIHLASIQPSSTATAHVVDSAFEERWAAWRARGLRHDMVVHRRMRAIALVIAIVLALVTLRIVVAGGTW